MNLQDCKKAILDFASSATQNRLSETVVSSLLVGGGSLATASMSPLLTIPILLGGYLLYSNAKNKLDEKANIEKLNSIFEKIKAGFIPKLQQIRDTEITLLEEELNNKLLLKKSNEEIALLKELIISILEDKESTLQSIVENLRYSETEIEELLKSSEWIKNSLRSISTDITSILHGQNKMQETLDRIISAQDHIPTSLNVLQLQNLILSGTPALLIKTGVNDSFDVAAQLIWDDIIHGDCTSAQKRMNDIEGDISCRDSISAKIWIFALWAKIYYTSGEIDKANEEARKSEELFLVCSSLSSPYILKTIYSKRHISQGDTAKARMYLDDILKKGYNFEAKALWLSISQISGTDALAQLSKDETENYIIAEILAHKFLYEKDYDRAVLFARQSFNCAKENNLYPPFMTLATALLQRKFQSPIVTAGFIRNHVNPNTWSDFYTIIDLYKENLSYIQNVSADAVKSICYYNLAMINFICGRLDDAIQYVHHFFKLQSVLQSLLEPCISILLAEGLSEDALEILKKKESLLNSGLLFLYGYLLTKKQGSEKIKGLEILTRIVEKIKVPNSSDVINSAMRLGEIYLSDKNDDAFNSLVTQLDQKSEKLAKSLLFALKFAEKDTEQARAFVAEIEPLIPSDSHEREKLFPSLIPLLKKIRMGQLILRLLENIVPKDEVTEAGREYFNIAIWEKDYERVQTFGRTLRIANAFDAEFILAEINFVLSYSPKDAEVLTSDILSSCNLDTQLHKTVKILHDMTTVQTGNFEHEKHAIDDYPTVEEIDIQKPPYPYCNIPFLLKNAGFYNEAIRYAYNMYLRFPKDKIVRRTLYGILVLQSDKFALDDPSTVSEDSVFSYGNPDCHIPEQAVIVENSPFAVSGMKSTSDTIIKQVLGKSVGFEFSIDNWGLPLLRIISIRNKYTYVAQQLMNEDSYDPDSSIRMIMVPSTPDGEKDFAQVFMMLQAQSKQREQQITQARRFFFEALPSFYVFRTIVSWELHQTLRYFAQQADLYIHSAIGSTEERNTAFAILKKEDVKLVLSPLTIEILILLDALFNVPIIDILHKSGLKFCISEYILEYFMKNDQIILSFEHLCIAGDTLGLVKDHIAERCHNSLQHMQKFLAKIEKISGRLDDQEFTHTSADQNTKWFWGKEYFHTLQIASATPNLVIWDDDMQALNMCNRIYDFKIEKRVFSQAVFLLLNNNGLISAREKIDANIFLITINEKFTSFDANTLFELFFNIDKYPGLVPRVAAYFVDAGLEEQSLINVLAQTTRKFATQYTNLRRAKEGLKKLYDICIAYNRPLAAAILYQSLRKASGEDRNKARPIIMYILHEIDIGWNRDVKKELMALAQIYR